MISIRPIFYTILLIFLFTTAFCKANNPNRQTTSQHLSRTDSLKNALLQSKGVDRIDLLNELGHTCADTATERSISYLNESIKLAEKLKKNKKLAFAYRFRGMAHNYRGCYTNALNDLKKALELQKEFSDKKEEVIILTNMGISYRYLNQFEKAIEVYTQSCRINDELKDILSNAIVYHNIGNLYNSLSNNKKAVKFYKKAHNIACTQNHTYGMAVTGLAIARTYRDSKQFDSSMVFFNMVEILLDSIKSNTMYASYYLSKGDLYKKINKNQKAIEYYKQAESYAIRNNHFNKLSNVYLELGILYNEINNYDEAGKYLHKSLKLSEESESAEKVSESQLHLGHYYFNVGQYKKAFDFLDKHLTLRDSLFHKDTEAKISDLEIKYETEKKEKENMALRTETEINYLMLSQKNYVIYSLIGGIVIVLILLSLIYWQYQKKGNAFQALVKQNIELARLDLAKKDYLKNTVKEKIAIKNPVTKSIMLEDANVDLLQKLEQYFVEEKPFLQAKLSLDDLAKELNTNRTYLSKAINEGLHKNFNDLLNEYRIKEARLLLLDKQYNHISIDGIGSMVGFATRSSFYNNFNKNFGISPSYFRQSIKK